MLLFNFYVYCDIVMICFYSRAFSRVRFASRCFILCFLLCFCGVCLCCLCIKSCFDLNFVWVLMFVRLSVRSLVARYKSVFLDCLLCGCV